MAAEYPAGLDDGSRRADQLKRLMINLVLLKVEIVPAKHFPEALEMCSPPQYIQCLQ